MEQLQAVFEQARQARDPRFDGRFFVGVLTTGIYCRPICPVRMPRAENVRLFPSAAAAAEAGFRPCLRCRPESAPGTPEWLGSSYTVSRALQLIHRGQGNDNEVASLAQAVGLSPRQLSRLFIEHVGATPAAVIRTRRLHFAKKLLDETRLPIAEVCFAAGFSSVRRFNDVIRKTYGLSPRDLRKNNAPVVSAGNCRGITTNLSYRPPFDYRSMLAFFARRAVPGVEAVTASSYARSFSLAGQTGSLNLTFDESAHFAVLEVQYTDSSKLLGVVEKVRDLFDLRADSAMIDNLFARDAILSKPVTRFPGMRVPGCWDGLEITVRAIVGQQVSVAAASTLMGRLIVRAGVYDSMVEQATSGRLDRVFPDAGTLQEADLDGLGITGRRVEAIKDVAAAVLQGELSFDGSQSSEQFQQRIRQIRGIGEWTAGYIAMRVLRDPDAFIQGDLILQRAAGNGERVTARHLLELSESWRPWRAYAAILLWRHYQELKAQSAKET